MNKNNGKSSKMYNKKSHVHHFVGEGAEEGNFNEAFLGLKGLIRQYKELEKDYNNNNEEEEEQEEEQEDEKSKKSKK